MHGKNNSILVRIIRKFELLKYNIAFLDNDLKSIVQGEKLSYNLLKHNDKNWFADPFILDVTEEHIILLVEEYNYKRWKGEIAKLVVDRNTYSLLEKHTLLVLDTHLSYPAIVRNGNDVIVYPENGSSNELYTYNYNKSLNRLKKSEQLLEMAVADATITDLFGDRFLFCTKQHVCSGKELSIFKEINRKWEEYQTVVFDEKIARMAGDFFEIKGTIYRPAQDCNESYGHGTVIQKVEFVGNKFVFTNVTRYFSPDKRLNQGIHTLNSYKNVTVVDMEGYEWPLLAKIAKSLRTFI